ncbi:hypothetical protein SE17_36995 [Kouleothrix aurantiaca]|uniref:Uncharacterized protein n=1 Tax=Kouleothrix aurantiaca TaxID=186479 RepID=A0A0P9EWC2_9CHLR|nr:hypothetical protein SE17_36995 [Kouleothrix aurantiaca]
MLESQAARTVPLSAGQRARLIIEMVPLGFFVLALLFVVFYLPRLTGTPPSLALILFLGLVVAVMAWIALQRLRDLTAGAALVEEDRLERLVRSRSASGPQAFHGRFERLGRMRLSRAAYKTGQNGARYRVFYSPASRIVWALEPLEG